MKLSQEQAGIQWYSRFGPYFMAHTQIKMRTEQELLLALERNIDGAVAIASTVRAARSLRHRYNRRQRTAGRKGWRTPTILAWEPWLHTLWDATILRGTESRILLTPAQEAELWRQILRRDEVAAQTVSIESLAEQAQQTWDAMQMYRVFLRDVHNAEDIDAQAFFRWTASMENICRRSSFVSPSQIEVVLAHAIALGQIPLPQEIFLVGFDRTTPAQNVLTDALQARDCNMQWVELEQTAITTSDAPAIVYALTQEEEIDHAAHWIRHTLLKNPEWRIGVIVSEQAEIRDRVDAIFRHVLAPSSMDIHASGTSLPYEFSLGTPLHRMQPIRTALTLLQCLGAPMPTEEISWLVTHGAFSSGSADARAMLDRLFRERKYRMGSSISLSSFLEWIPGIEGKIGVLPLRYAMERLAVAAARHDLRKMRSYADWREIVEDLLATAEWKLPTPSDSAEYQLLRRWNALLNEFSSLNAVAGQVAFSSVLETLKRLAANMIFTLETSNAPVQILGASESAGISFDCVWWLNAQANSWPPRGHVQPFLPWSVQRAAHMPYADPAEDHAFALRVTRRILASAGTAIVSFALQESDPATASAHVPGPEIAVSRVVRDALPDVPLASVKDFFLEQTGFEIKVTDASVETSVLDTVDAEPAVPRRPGPVSGGVSFLKHQAACPFRAFAELRLGAEPIEYPVLGLSPAEQGSIVHKVLQNFWRAMRSQKELLHYTEKDCRQMLREHIRSALQGYFEYSDEAWKTSLLEIETDRIEGRLLQWLEVEKRRPGFTILETEHMLEGALIGGVELRCRIDRIDAVEQGIALIDYKMGAVSASDCEGDRPDEPQLPAYAVLRRSSAPAEESLAGIAFAGLRARNVEFTVVGSLPGVFSLLPETSKNKNAHMSREHMEQRQEVWGTTLTRLAEEFRMGMAIVDPKYGHKTCERCSQALLCRVRETDIAATTRFEEEDPDSTSGTNDMQGPGE